MSEIHHTLTQLHTPYLPPERARWCLWCVLREHRPRYNKTQSVSFKTHAVFSPMCFAEKCDITALTGHIRSHEVGQMGIDSDTFIGLQTLTQYGSWCMFCLVVYPYAWLSVRLSVWLSVGGSVWNHDSVDSFYMITVISNCIFIITIKTIIVIIIV